MKRIEAKRRTSRLRHPPPTRYLLVMSRLRHDTAFVIASVLTQKMAWKLESQEREAFHELVYQTCKGAIADYDRKRDLEERRLRPQVAER